MCDVEEPVVVESCIEINHAQTACSVTAGVTPLGTATANTTAGSAIVTVTNTSFALRNQLVLGALIQSPLFPPCTAIIGNCAIPPGITGVPACAEPSTNPFVLMLSTAALQSATGITLTLLPPGTTTNTISADVIFSATGLTPNFVFVNLENEGLVPVTVVSASPFVGFSVMGGTTTGTTGPTIQPGASASLTFTDIATIALVAPTATTTPQNVKVSGSVRAFFCVPGCEGQNCTKSSTGSLKFIKTCGARSSSLKLCCDDD